MNGLSPTPEGVGRVVAATQAGILNLTLDRPGTGNALDYGMMLAVADAVAEAADDVKIRAIVLQGAGATFCAGDMPQDPGPWPARFAHRFSSGAHGSAPVVEQHMLRTVRSALKPVLAVLRGPTHGLGLDLAAVCDFRLAAPDVTFVDTRVQQARHAATGLTYTLPRLIGLSRATWMMLTGEALDALEAKRIGFVHGVHPAAALEGEAEAFARRLAALPTRSYAVKKEMTLAQLDLHFEGAMAHCLAVRQTNVIKDRAEGQNAWRERRQPQFTGE